MSGGGGYVLEPSRISDRFHARPNDLRASGRVWSKQCVHDRGRSGMVGSG